MQLKNIVENPYHFFENELLKKLCYAKFIEADISSKGINDFSLSKALKYINFKAEFLHFINDMKQIRIFMIFSRYLNSSNIAFDIQSTLVITNSRIQTIHIAETSIKLDRILDFQRVQKSREKVSATSIVQLQLRYKIIVKILRDLIG
ncbi:hypothetical protein RhiirC2_797865 [Rhizophagus irregularis]|uniref:Uncharacterized protein n=1 Tax=Rhizophagus irregularis TaxID=588596 RepID=A0A2N1M7B1_9GLOM|nr:hypothetical protein RhiirC2_797865 [Rhizophagus irregularis]